MTAMWFLRWTARESETFLSLRTGYKVSRVAIAYTLRSQGEDDEFKGQPVEHPSVAIPTILEYEFHVKTSRPSHEALAYP